jgi:hypothetical protein
MPANQPVDNPVDRYRCLCGISLWATQATSRPDVWARHAAHMRAYELGLTR